MLNNLLSFMKKSSGNKEMEKKKFVFIIEVDVKGKGPRGVVKKIREARKIIKAEINLLKDIKITRITNKEV